MQTGQMGTEPPTVQLVGDLLYYLIYTIVPPGEKIIKEIKAHDINAYDDRM